MVAAALVVVSVAGCKRAPLESPRIRVAAASDLGDAFPAVAEAFTRESGTKVDFTFGSSGVLSKQLAEGAPFDLFASADTSYAEAAIKAGVCDSATAAPYARGPLVVVCPAGAPTNLAGLAAPTIATIAIASPEHAPYGRAAMDALGRAGLATTLRPKLVYATNIGESLQFARSGNADCAFASRALVRDLPAAQVLVVPKESYTPLVQALVVCGTSAEGRARATAFSAFVRGPSGQRILASFGFDPPGGPP